MVDIFIQARWTCMLVSGLSVDEDVCDDLGCFTEIDMEEM